MQPPPDLSVLSVPELVNMLMVKLYEPPLVQLYADFGALPEGLRTLVLIADFDTEVSMNGLEGFIENSPGARLPETIVAFEAIGATTTAETLKSVQLVMEKHGFTHLMLRETMGKLQPFSVASFAEVHGPEAARMAQEIRALGTRLYVYNPQSDEPVFELLCSHLKSFRADLERAASAA